MPSGPEPADGPPSPELAGNPEPVEGRRGRMSASLDFRHSSLVLRHLAPATPRTKIRAKSPKVDENNPFTGLSSALHPGLGCDFTEAISSSPETCDGTPSPILPPFHCRKTGHFPVKTFPKPGKNTPKQHKTSPPGHAFFPVADPHWDPKSFKGFPFAPRPL